MEANEEIGNKIREMKRRMEKKEREERRRNILIKGAEVNVGRRNVGDRGGVQ